MPFTPDPKYVQFAHDEAAKRGIPSGLLPALLHTESGWNPNAVSPTGATGIAQFIKSTADSYNVNRTDPYSSITGAANYLQDLGRQYGGDWRAAVAAYNGGTEQGNLVHAGRDPTRTETANYVPSVMNRLSLYGGNGTPTPAQGGSSGASGEEYIKLPNGSYFGFKAGSMSGDQALIAAYSKYPDAFNTTPVEPTILGQGMKAIKGLGHGTVTGIQALFDPTGAAQSAMDYSKSLDNQYGTLGPWSQVGDTYRTSGVLPAAYQALRLGAGEIASAAPMVGAGLAAGTAGTAVGGPFGGAAAASAALAPSMLSQNVEEQGAQQTAQGQPLNIDMTKAGLATAGQTLLNVGTLRMAGARFFSPYANIAKTEGTEAAKRALIKDALDNLTAKAERSTGASALRGAAVGAATMPVDLASQQVLTRWQAGEDLTSPEALESYGHAIISGGLVGGVFGAGHGVYDRSQAGAALQGATDLKSAMDRADQQRAKDAEDAANAKIRDAYKAMFPELFQADPTAPGADGAAPKVIPGNGKQRKKFGKQKAVPGVAAEPEDALSAMVPPPNQDGQLLPEDYAHAINNPAMWWALPDDVRANVSKLAESERNRIALEHQKANSAAFSTEQEQLQNADSDYHAAYVADQPRAALEAGRFQVDPAGGISQAYRDAEQARLMPDPNASKFSLNGVIASLRTTQDNLLKHLTEVIGEAHKPGADIEGVYARAQALRQQYIEHAIQEVINLRAKQDFVPLTPEEAAPLRTSIGSALDEAIMRGVRTKATAVTDQTLTRPFGTGAGPDSAALGLVKDSIDSAKASAAAANKVDNARQAMSPQYPPQLGVTRNKNVLYPQDQQALNLGETPPAQQTQDTTSRKGAYLAIQEGLEKSKMPFSVRRALNAVQDFLAQDKGSQNLREHAFELLHRAAANHPLGPEEAKGLMETLNSERTLQRQPFMGENVPGVQQKLEFGKIGNARNEYAFNSTKEMLDWLKSDDTTKLRNAHAKAVAHLKAIDAEIGVYMRAIHAEEQAKIRRAEEAVAQQGRFAAQRAQLEAQRAQTVEQRAKDAARAERLKKLQQERTEITAIRDAAIQRLNEKSPVSKKQETTQRELTSFQAYEHHRLEAAIKRLNEAQVRGEPITNEMVAATRPRLEITPKIDKHVSPAEPVHATTKKSLDWGGVGVSKVKASTEAADAYIQRMMEKYGVSKAAPVTQEPSAAPIAEASAKTRLLRAEARNNLANQRKSGPTLFEASIGHHTEAKNVPIGTENKAAPGASEVPAPSLYPSDRTTQLRLSDEARNRFGVEMKHVTDPRTGEKVWQVTVKGTEHSQHFKDEQSAHDHADQLTRLLWDKNRVDKDAVRKELTDHFGEDDISNLERHGRLDYGTTDPLGRGAAAQYDPAARKATLFTSHMRKGEAVATLIHELGEHHALADYLGEDNYRVLLSDVQKNRDSGPLKKVYDRVAESYLKHDPRFEGMTRDDLLNNRAFVAEVVAIAGQDAAARNQNWFTNVAESIRRFFRENFGIGTLDENAIGHLLYASMKHTLREAGDPRIRRLDAVQASIRSGIDATAGREQSKGYVAPEALRSAVYGDTKGRLAENKMWLYDNFVGPAARTQWIDRGDINAKLQRLTERRWLANKNDDAAAKDAFAAVQADLDRRMVAHSQMLSAQALSHGVPSLEKTVNKHGIAEYAVKSDSANPSFKDIDDILHKNNRDSATFGLYMTAKRAQAEGWNRLNYSEGWMDKNRPMLEETMRQCDADPVMRAAAEKLGDYNKALIKLAVDSKWLSPEVAAKLRPDTYVGFYRNKDSVELVVGEERVGKVGNLKDQPELKSLLGDTNKIEDWQAALIKNTNMIIHAALHNRATANTAHHMERLGMGKMLEGNYSNVNAVHFNDWDADSGKAQPRTFVVDAQNPKSMYKDVPTEAIVKGLEGVATNIPFLVSLMAKPANFMRRVTVDNPVYLFKVLLKEPLALWGTSGADFVPFLSTTKEFIKIFRGKSASYDSLVSRGIISSHIMTGTAQDITRQIRDAETQHGVLGKTLSFLDKLAMSAEGAVRVTAYNSYLKSGLTPMEAGLGALRNGVDFFQKGVSPTIRWGRMLVPFMGSQITSLDNMYQAMRGNLPFSERLSIQRKFFQRGMMLAGASIAYAMANMDNEDYKNIPSEERYNNFFLPLGAAEQAVGGQKFLKVPIPFEFGYVFKMLPEMMLNHAYSDGTHAEFFDNAKSALMGSTPGIIPAAIKPLLEATTNYDFFSGRPIETSAQQRQTVTERFTMNTTEAAKAASFELANIGGTSYGMSPVMLEHFIRGYGGPVGIAVAQILSLAALEAAKQGGSDLAGIGGPRPSMRLSETPLAGTLFTQNDGLRYLEIVSGYAKEASERADQYKREISQNRFGDAASTLDKHRAQLAYAPVAKQFNERMQQITEMENKIRYNPVMSADAKRQQLDQLQATKNNIAKSYEPLLRRSASF